MEVIYKSYIPPVLAKTKEFKALDKTVDINLEQIWDKLDATLRNQFIESCDEDGITYFESLCGIRPSDSDSLEFRKALVLAKWNDKLPYNYALLIRKLTDVCGEGGFEVYPYWDTYQMDVVIHSIENIASVEKLIRDIIPCNIYMVINNELAGIIKGFTFFGGSVTTTKDMVISTPDTSVQEFNSFVNYGAAITMNKHINIGG